MAPDSVPEPLPDLHALIMAGGSGTRFWPISRRHLPKQFLALGGEASLLRQTFERLEPLVTAGRTWVVTHASHVARVRFELPEVPGDHVIGEPEARNTAPCIGIAARRLAEESPGASLLVCPADHVIRPAGAFHSAVRAAARLLSTAKRAEAPVSVTFGIVPRHPATGFGYIERGAGVKEAPGPVSSYRAERFREKPDLETAKAFLESGRFYWNSGIFLWTVPGILDLIGRHLPELASGLETIASRAREGEGFPAALRSVFPALPSISIDHGVLERAANVVVVEAPFEWDDVGSWAAFAKYAPRDDAGNSVRGRHLGLDTRECIVVGKERLIVTVGVEGIVIVETEDALLVCRRDQTERVKEVVERIREKGMEELL